MHVWFSINQQMRYLATHASQSLPIFLVVTFRIGCRRPQTGYRLKLPITSDIAAELLDSGTSTTWAQCGNDSWWEPLEFTHEEAMPRFINMSQLRTVERACLISCNALHQLIRIEAIRGLEKLTTCMVVSLLWLDFRAVCQRMTVPESALEQRLLTAPASSRDLNLIYMM